MSAENKALIRRLIDEVWNQKNLSMLEQVVSPGYICHEPGSPEPLSGLEGFNTYTSAFPDQRFTIEDLVAEGDRVVTRWSVEGTHSRKSCADGLWGRPVACGGPTPRPATFIKFLVPKAIGNTPERCAESRRPANGFG